MAMEVPQKGASGDPSPATFCPSPTELRQQTWLNSSHEDSVATAEHPRPNRPNRNTSSPYPEQRSPGPRTWSFWQPASSHLCRWATHGSTASGWWGVTAATREIADLAAERDLAKPSVVTGPSAPSPPPSCSALCTANNADWQRFESMCVLHPHKCMYTCAYGLKESATSSWGLSGCF